MNRHTSRGPAGYSLVEMLATLSILAVLVGLVTFGSEPPVDRAKLGRLLVERLRLLVTAHRAVEPG